MSKKEVVKSAVAEVLKSSGFHKKSDCWYERTKDAILVVNLQKSQFGGQYYLNLGVWLNKLGPATFPKEHHCHIRTRLESVRESGLARALNSDDESVADGERKRLIILGLSEQGIPWLRRCGELGSLKKMLEGGVLIGAMVHKNVKALLAELRPTEDG
ncbi:MAG: DUF4304 domain-containing protein [Actinobacteria bacterium]|nr:DUF4304 domain-containing protein [Actinomycetota bacterium]